MGINLERQKQSWTLDNVITNLNSTSTAADFANSMQNIDARLNEIKKEITYWDVYNISSAITAPEIFDSKVANLEINNSAVINTTYFKRNFQGIETEFHSGDVIIRLKDGSYQHIKAANAGVYVPTLESFTQTELADYYQTNFNKDTIITIDGDYYIWNSQKGFPKDQANNDIFPTKVIITYNYETTPPLGEIEDNTDKDGYKTYSTTIESLSGDNSKMYGYSVAGTYDGSWLNVTFTEPYGTGRNTFQFDILYDETNIIVPVVKFFDENNQEVFTEEYSLYQGSQTHEDIWSRDDSKFYFYLHNNLSGLIQKVVIK